MIQTNQFSLKERFVGQQKALLDIIPDIQTHYKYIDSQDLDLQNKMPIGKGSYGTVYSTIMYSKGMKVAIKEYQGISLNQNCQDKQVQQIVSEIDIFSQIQSIQSDQILEFIGYTYYITPNKQFIKFYIIMELCQGSLYNYIEYVKENQQVQLKNILDFMYQIFKVLATCEQQNIAHRDLKPQNIMIKDFNRFKIKLGDFSDSVRKEDKFQKSTIQTVHGTPQYFSPQLLYRYNNEWEQIQYNSFKSDLYSVGVIIVQICKLNQFTQWERNVEWQMNPEYFQGSILGPNSQLWNNVLMEIGEDFGIGQDHKFFSILMQCLAYKEIDRPQCFQIYQEFLDCFQEYNQIPNKNIDLDARKQEYIFHQDNAQYQAKQNNQIYNPYLQQQFQNPQQNNNNFNQNNNNNYVNNNINNNTDYMNNNNNVNNNKNNNKININISNFKLPQFDIPAFKVNGKGKEGGNQMKAKNTKEHQYTPNKKNRKKQQQQQQNGNNFVPLSQNGTSNVKSKVMKFFGRNEQIQEKGIQIVCCLVLLQIIKWIFFICFGYGLIVALIISLQKGNVCEEYEDYCKVTKYLIGAYAFNVTFWFFCAYKLKNKKKCYYFYALFVEFAVFSLGVGLFQSQMSEFDQLKHKEDQLVVLSMANAFEFVVVAIGVIITNCMNMNRSGLQLINF